MSFTRFKMASVLNVLSLMAAFAVFIIIIAQVRWEMSFNSGIEDSERVYNISMGATLNRPLGEMIGTSSPYIESYTIYDTYKGEWPVYNIGKHRDVTSEEFYQVLPSYVDVFSLKTVEGDLRRISEPDKVIIPQSIAEKYFADTTAIGGVIETTRRKLEIVGVYEDFPENSTVKNAILEDFGDKYIDLHDEWSFDYFYKLTPEANIEHVKEDIAKFIANDNIIAATQKEAEEFVNELSFTSFDDIYYNGSLLRGVAKGNRALTLILLMVAIVIIVIASINYINLFMALVPVRIRNVNISKVFGASNAELRRNVIFEAIAIAFIGLLLALPVVQLVANMSIGNFTPASLRLEDNIVLILVSAVIAVGVGLLAGVFPSLYITSFSPAIVLKGSFGRSVKGRTLRTVLTSFQFVVSIVLIVVSIFIILQNKYMRDYDYGIEKDNIVNVYFGGGGDAAYYETIGEEIKKHPQVEGVSFSDHSIFKFGMTWGRNSENGESINFKCLLVNWHYPEFMGMELVDGRFFIEDDSSKPGGTAIFNETAARAFNLKVGDKFAGHNDKHMAEIVGIVKDFNYRSLEEEIAPVCLYESGSEPWRNPSYINVRVAEEANFAEISEHIKASILKLYPDANLSHYNITSMENDLEEIYHTEERIADVISIFSVISIIISLLGLFGIVESETQYRKKEVALRKIHGATVWQVLGLFIGQSMKVLCVSAVVAVPIAWFVVREWLEGYAYREEMHWWVFVVAVLMVVLLVIAIVVSQTWRAAMADPKRSLEG